MIDVTKEITEEQFSIQMSKNTQGFDENYPLGFMSPGGFIRLQVTELSNNGTPRYAFPQEGCSYSISLFGKEYNEGRTWGTDHSDWIPINTKKELVMALQIQDLKREQQERISNKNFPNAAKILNEFLPNQTFAAFHPDIKLEIIAAMNKVAHETFELNK